MQMTKQAPIWRMTLGRLNSLSLITYSQKKSGINSESGKPHRANIVLPAASHWLLDSVKLVPECRKLDGSEWGNQIGPKVCAKVTM